MACIAPERNGTTTVARASIETRPLLLNEADVKALLARKVLRPGGEPASALPPAAAVAEELSSGID